MNRGSYRFPRPANNYNARHPVHMECWNKNCSNYFASPRFSYCVPGPRPSPIVRALLSSQLPRVDGSAEEYEFRQQFLGGFR